MMAGVTWMGPQQNQWDHRRPHPLAPGAMSRDHCRWCWWR